MKKSNKLRKVVLFLLGGCFLAVGLIFIYGNYLFNSTLNQMTITAPIQKHEANIAESLINKESETQIFNIAVFGLNQYGDEHEALKVLSLDLKNKQAKLTGLHRDILVFIPDDIQDYNNLTYAYENGGANLVMKTANYNFDLDLTRYVSFDSNAIGNIIDTLGGINFDIKNTELGSINDNIDVTSNRLSFAGYQSINGEQAIAYMSIDDHSNSNINRQELIMDGIFEKIKSIPYTHMVEVFNELLPFIETNLTKTEIMNLGLDALKVNLDSVAQYSLPNSNYIKENQGISYRGSGPLYVANNYQTLVKELHANIYGDTNYQPSENIIKNETLIYERFGSLKR